MPWRSRLIASIRSSRSVVSVVCWVSTSPSSSSARRLTAPSRSRSRRSFSRSVSMLATSGSAASGSMLASAATPSGSTSSISLISCCDVGEPALGAFDPFGGAGGLFAGGAERFERRAHRAVELAEDGLGLGQLVGGLAARAFGGLDLADQREALLRKGLRRVRERGALFVGFSAAGFERARSAPARPRGVRSIACGRRRSPTAGGRPARPRAPAPALPRARRRPGRACLRCRCAPRRAGSPDRRTAAASASAPVGGLARGLRLVAAGNQPALGFGQGRNARGVAGDFALGRGMQFAGVVGLALRLRAAVARAALGGSRGGDVRGRLSRRLHASRSTSARALTSSPSMSAKRLRSASRRAAPVGACASAAKPSQRHRSPSAKPAAGRA